MKINDIKAKSIEQINKDLNDLLKLQFSLRMKIASQQQNDLSQVRKVRRDIARSLTILHEKVVL